MNLAVSTAFICLAFTAVGDLPRCTGLVLADVSCTFTLPPLCSLVNTPVAKAPIIVDHEEWYNIIASLLAGRKRNVQYHESCLFSGWGWSVFKDSFADCDPFDTVPGRIWIQRGVPFHDGAVAHLIRDGPCTINNGMLWAAKVDGFNDSFEPKNALQVTPARSMVAHRGDEFFVCKRYRNQEVGTFSAIGFGKLAASRFVVHVVEPCGHNCTGDPERLKLCLGMATVKGFTFGQHEHSPSERVCICLTHGDENARWLSLVGLRETQPKRTPVLRGPQTCVSCFVSKGVSFEGDLLLIFVRFGDWSRVIQCYFLKHIPKYQEISRPLRP